MSNERINAFVGSWQGNCRTWFEPGKLADESIVVGEIQPILGGLFFRHAYQGTIQGRKRSGEETIAFNTIKAEYETAWVDDFHMSDSIMFSTGAATSNGFAVTGKYAVGADAPPWSWKTVYEKVDDDHLTITAYNISPDGQETKAVETKYTRQ